MKCEIQIITTSLGNNIINNSAQNLYLINHSYPVIPYNMINTFYYRKLHFDIMDTYKNSRLTDIQYPAGGKQNNKYYYRVQYFINELK